MGLLDRLTNAQEDASKRISGALEIQNMREEVTYLSGELKMAQEDMLRISDAFDNVGWSPLPGDEANEMPLKTVKKVSELARAMYAMNPFIKSGVSARIEYVWGKGVSFDGIDGITENMESNRKKLFNSQAYEELERVLATDGNAFTALPVENEVNTANKASAFRITLDEIEGVVANPIDKEEIWYYKREYTVQTVNSVTGEPNDKKSVIKYYPSMSYYQKLQDQGKNLPRRWGKYGVEQNYVIQHVAVNKQVGWRWGVPDIMPVIFWAKAYKEYLEDNALLVKAYSRLAWQVKASSAGGAQAAAAQVMTPPSRDPMTGNLRDVGGTAIGGPGSELSPVAATGSSVDFSKGSPLASAIAAGLEVSLVVITRDPGSGNRATAETLDLPTLKAMESRQQLHTDRFLELFEFWGANIHQPLGKKDTKDISEADPEKKAKDSGPDVALVTWPQIYTETSKDRVTALGTAVELGILFKQEARKEAIDLFGIAPYKPWDELPTMEDDPAAKEKMDMEQQNAEVQFQREQQAASVIAKQGNSGGVAASGGNQTSSNSARNNRSADQNKS